MAQNTKIFIPEIMTLDPTCSHPLPSHQEGPAQPLALCARMGVHATSTRDGCGCDVSAPRALKPHYACTMRALPAITISALPLKRRLSNLRSTVTGRAGVSTHMEHKERQLRDRFEVGCEPVWTPKMSMDVSDAKDEWQKEQKDSCCCRS